MKLIGYEQHSCRCHRLETEIVIRLDISSPRLRRDRADRRTYRCIKVPQRQFIVGNRLPWLHHHKAFLRESCLSLFTHAAKWIDGASNSYLDPATHRESVNTRDLNLSLVVFVCLSCRMSNHEHVCLILIPTSQDANRSRCKRSLCDSNADEMK
jgi:hypothetical protein